MKTHSCCYTQWWENRKISLKIKNKKDVNSFKSTEHYVKEVCKNGGQGAGEISHQLGVHGALVEDAGLILITLAEWRTANCNPSSTGLQGHRTQVCILPHRNTHKYHLENKSLKSINKPGGGTVHL